MTTNGGKTGVVLLQLGGPDALESVEPFLYNIFVDPDIIDLPLAFLFRKPLARTISSRRAPKVRDIYRRIGGKSPILRLTLRQAKALERVLTPQLDCRVVIAMRYWNPLTREAIDQLIKEHVSEIVLLPLYPQYSIASTGSSVNEWHRVVRGTALRDVPVRVVEEYCDHPKYISALARNIRIALRRVPARDIPRVHLLFSAHGTPMKLVNAGDPYRAQIERTYAAAVKEVGFSGNHSLCFQSKVGPQKWLEPSLTATIEELARKGTTHVVVVPVAFVSDHSETLFEINMEARHQAKALGIKYFDMSPALHTNPLYIQALADCVRQAVHR
jgi:protoporphyrin/coproporphyrin ferrochelatase